MTTISFSFFPQRSMSNPKKDNTLAEQARLAKDEGITIFTIGVGNRKHIKFSELEAVSSDPHNRHAFLAEDFDSLISTIGKFELETHTSKFRQLFLGASNLR